MALAAGGLQEGAQEGALHEGEVKEPLVVLGQGKGSDAAASEDARGRPRGKAAAEVEVSLSGEISRYVGSSSSSSLASSWDWPPTRFS